MDSDSFNRGRAGEAYSNDMDRYAWEQGRVEAGIYGSRPAPSPFGFDVKDHPGAVSLPRSSGGGNVDVSAGIAGIGRLAWWWVSYTISLRRWCLPLGAAGAGLALVLLGLGVDLSGENAQPQPDWEIVAGYALTGASIGWVVGTLFRVARGLYRAVRPWFGVSRRKREAAMYSLLPHADQLPWYRPDPDGPHSA